MLYITILILLLAIILFVAAFMRQPMFGGKPVGERLAEVEKSPNYKQGQFRNLHLTPALTEGVSYYSVMKEFFFEKKKRKKPTALFPSAKTDLLSLDPAKDLLVWFGHSSYFMQIDGTKMLVDPVLSGAASPIKATTRSFKGADIYTADELPEIDYLFISHDHWDHLDYDTIIRLKPKVKMVICGLGVGQHLQRWGYCSNQVIEKDWGAEVKLDNGFTLNITPGRHFSGRAFKRNISLWISFVLKTPSLKLFLGGDSGYDTHFAEIGQKFGPFDLALLECGQYDKSWKYIHLMPEETVKAARELGAKALMPVHWGKFSLANHAWDDPIRIVSALVRNEPIMLITPMIGETVDLHHLKEFDAWWEKIN